MDKHLDTLSKIQKVETPPFLYTRILQKIQAQQELVQPRQAWALSAAMAVIILINILVVNYHHSQPADNNLLQTMNLNPQNSLY